MLDQLGTVSGKYAGIILNRVVDAAELAVRLARPFEDDRRQSKVPTPDRCGDPCGAAADNDHVEFGAVYQIILIAALQFFVRMTRRFLSHYDQFCHLKPLNSISNPF